MHVLTKELIIEGQAFVELPQIAMNGFLILLTRTRLKRVTLQSNIVIISDPIFNYSLSLHIPVLLLPQQ